jgi:hypothetical protein
MCWLAVGRPEFYSWLGPLCRFFSEKTSDEETLKMSVAVNRISAVPLVTD